jgi:adenosylcobinamide-phosphate synthase
MLLTGTANPFLILLLALALDFALGDLGALWRILPHPVAWAGGAIGWLDRRLNRLERSDAARLWRGIFSVALLAVAALALGGAIEGWLLLIPHGWIVEVVVVAVMLAQKSLLDHVAAVATALKREGLEAGRMAVRHIVGRDPDSLDEHGVARAAIESLAENFCDGVVAPALWYAVAGLPGLFLYKTANTLDSMIGHRSPRYLQFGWAAARFDDLLNLVPARLAAAMLVLAALILPQVNGRAAFATMIADAKKHRSPNAGWPESAAAGALGLALGGPRRYGGSVVQDEWLGAGRARATVADIGAALKLYLAACLVQATLVLAALIASPWR